MLIQHLLNGIVIAAGFTLIGISFLIVFRIQRFLDFSYAIPFTAAPYFALALARGCGLPLSAAVLIGVLAAGIIGGLVHLIVFRPLARRNAPPLVKLLASLGLYTVFVNLISLSVGDDPVSLLSRPVSTSFSIAGAWLTVWQAAVPCSAAVLVVVVSLVLSRTRCGITYQAVCTDTELASICGLESNRVTAFAVVVGSALAGVSGIILGINTSVEPEMGLKALFMGVVVVVVGGGQRVTGVVLAALLVAFAQTIGTWRSSASWQNAIAFAVLLGFLLFMPGGIMGKRTTKATV